MIASIAAFFTIGVLVYLVRMIGAPSAEDYRQCRGLDKLED